ncbi:MAG: acyl-ACP--UDP-N-acetylglucosamine O-acyltransferase [Planctomycetes bacterium]|nr:acyl-ACP--UDP-N-acetylglucosamine O-acyltransferase [Planctomycetota bacterium]
MAVHPLAVVGRGVVLGSDVEIGPFACVADDVVLGDGVVVMSHASILDGVRLDTGCVVHQGAVLGGDPQNRAYRGDRTFLHVAPRTVFREFTTVSRGTKAGAATRIGSDCMLMMGAHVGHDCCLGDRVTIANAGQVAGHCEIHDGATIGGISVLHQFVRVGRLAMIGFDSVVRQDAPPFMLTSGPTPALVYGLNRVGLARASLSIDARRELKQAFQFLYRSGLNTSQAVERIRAELACLPETIELLEFIGNSRRGLCSGARRLRPRAVPVPPEIPAPSCDE